MTKFTQIRTSRILSVFVLFTLLSGFFVFPVYAKPAATNSSLSSTSRQVNTPSWLLSLLKDHQTEVSNGMSTKEKGAIPTYVTLNQKVNIKSQTPGNFIYYSPSEVRNAYNATSLLNNGYNGTGVTISIVDAFGDPLIQSELNTFSAEYGIPTTTVHVACVDGPCNYTEGITTGWNGEIALDVEWAHAMAPGATINLYIASNNMQPLYDAVAAAVAGTTGNGTYFSPSSIISMSWGSPENDIGESGSIAPVFGPNYPWLNEVFQQGTAEGMTFFASTGDWGAYDQGLPPSGQTSPYGGPLYPSTDPFVTAVGGTSLYLSTTSGYLQFPGNATGGYGYETAWSWNNYYGWATGGGFSTFFGQPPWQSGPGVPSQETRGVPDVSWDADVQTGVLVFVSGGFYIYGGTSVGSPSWAGSMALIDQAAGHNLGLINPSIYSILNNPSEYAKAFHDVTTGNNDPLHARAGWDPVTGIGTPNIGELAYYLAQPSTSLNVLASNNVALGTSASYTSVQIYATVTSGAGTVASGTVSAVITSSTNAVVGVVTMTYNGTMWTGTYTIKPTDPPGMWTATVLATSGSQSGTGTTTFSVGDGITIFASWGSFLVGDDILVEAIVTAPNGTVVTSGSFSSTFHLGTPTGSVEGTVPLAYYPSYGVWAGFFAISPSVSQGAWVLSINGTDSEGNRAATAYSWLSVGLVASVLTDSPTYVLGSTINIYSFINYSGYLPTTGSQSATVWDNGKSLGTVALSYSGVPGLWMGAFWEPSEPPGFYRIVVTGGDGLGNSVNGETLVRVAPLTLSVIATASPPEVLVNSIAGEKVSANVTYPNGTPMTVGSVEAFTSYGFNLRMTYNAVSGNFIGLAPVPTIVGTYPFSVVAFDPWGNAGEGLGSFSVLNSSVTSLLCSSPVAVGASSTCTATVEGSTPSGTVSFTASGSGNFFPSGVCTLSGGSCSVQYVPSTTAGSPQTITATYPGDMSNFGSSGTSSVTVNRAASKTSVVCSSSAILIGSKATCVATVTGQSPTKTVAWSQSGKGSVTFSTSKCTLVTGSCSVTVKGKTAGAVTVTATYSGDANNLGSSGSHKLVVDKVPTTLSLSCTPKSKYAWTCTAVLKGYLGSVKGEKITWSKVFGVGKVSFSPSTCALSSEGICWVNVQWTGAGSIKIEATYSGDTNNAGSQKTTTLTVK
jgi:hypothetical protein